MSDESKLKNHISVKYSSDLHDLIAPCLENTPINYFGIARVYDDGAHNHIAYDPLWAEHLLKNKYHLTGVEQALAQTELTQVVWSLNSMFNVNKRSRELYKEYIDNGYANGIVLIQKAKDFTEFFHISVEGSDNDAQDYIASHQDKLWNTVLYFREQLIKHPEISKACQNRYYYDEVLQADTRSIGAKTPEMKLRRLYLEADRKEAYLTPKEFECLRLASQQLSSKEIAALLNGSHRTVESCLEAVKTRFGFAKKSHLLHYLNQNPVFKALCARK